MKVQLPRNYNENLSKEYPLIIVLDGDYMFEAVSGSVDYLSYWGNIPESIDIDVTALDLGQSVRLTEINLPPYILHCKFL